MPLFYTEMLQVRNKIMVHWMRPEYDNAYSPGKFKQLRHNFKNAKTYTGMITECTAKRIRLAVDLLLQISPSRKVTNPYNQKVITHRLSFITLTIAHTKRNLTPKEGNAQLLKPFLRYMRDKDLMTTYIWKAEFQERGQLHYHITTPSVIDLRLIRKYWNGILTKNKLLEDYYNEHGHYDPNSTDIHQVHKLHDIQAYLVKYLSKSSQNQTATTGKIWDCSDNLKGKKHMSFEMNKHNMIAILKSCDSNKTIIKEAEHCSIIKGNNFKPSSLLDTSQRQQYNEYLLSIRDNP